MLELARNDPQLRHFDHAWASTVHAFQGRTVDNVIVVMEANHPHLTTQKSVYVVISSARHRTELVTDDRKALRERLEAATGERVSALDRDRAAVERFAVEEKDRGRGPEAMAVEPAATVHETAGNIREPEPEKAPEPKRIEHDLGLGRLWRRNGRRCSAVLQSVPIPAP